MDDKFPAPLSAAAAFQPWEPNGLFGIHTHGDRAKPSCCFAGLKFARQNSNPGNAALHFNEVLAYWPEDEQKGKQELGSSQYTVGQEMNAGRKAILTPDKQIAASDVSWHFIDCYYDGPISGLAIYQERILRFCCFEEDMPDHSTYVLQELTPEELAEEIRVKKKFELMVGTHGCFNERGELLPAFSAEGDSVKRFFEEEWCPDAPKASPFERQIVAWFDASEKQEPNKRTTDNSGASPLRV